jgi:hypothetical protein
MDDPNDDRDYDVCLSFAGEDREYVDEVAAELRGKGVRVFYDRYERAELWGKDLYEHLQWVYREAAKYCVLFVSEAYAVKLWTSHERKSAQARALETHGEYVLPARFDATEIPGLLPTVGYIDLAVTAPAELADLIVAKLGPRQTRDFFPPEPNRLYEALGADTGEEQGNVYWLAQDFFRALRRMEPSEREVVICIFLEGCVAELPDNLHISLDLLRRETGLPASQLVEVLGGIRSLGFRCRLRERHASNDAHELGHEGDDLAELRWTNLSDLEGEPMTVAHAIVQEAQDHYCEVCLPKAFERLDFSYLADATAEEHLD